MAGYNTFCEILSLDKRAILVPRVKPRLEQFMRAQRAAALGLVRTLDPQDVARSCRHGERVARARVSSRLPRSEVPRGCWTACG